MPTRTIIWTAVVCLWFAAAPAADAQIVEAVGERALGMGGAFVAVANDSSATWWNPAAQADGPFFDFSIGRAVTQREDAFPAGRDQVSGLALATPVIGAQVFRINVADAGHGDGLQPIRRWSATSVGGTIVQTLLDGTHVGATLKYVRGTARTGVAVPAMAPDAALEQAGELEGGSGESRFDFDIGALATAGVVRLGVVVRNVLAPEFAGGRFRLPRQARVGFAIATEAAGGPPLTISIDADVRAYVADGERRQVIALGAEQWLAGKRIGIRGGARVNTAGKAERAFTAGASVALRPGSYFEAHVVGGGTPAEQGWGTGIRVSF